MKQLLRSARPNAPTLSDGLVVAAIFFVVFAVFLGPHLFLAQRLASHGQAKTAPHVSGDAR